MVVFGEYDDGSAYVELPVLQGLQIYTGRNIVVCRSKAKFVVGILNAVENLEILIQCLCMLFM